MSTRIVNPDFTYGWQNWNCKTSYTTSASDPWSNVGISTGYNSRTGMPTSGDSYFIAGNYSPVPFEGNRGTGTILLYLDTQIYIPVGSVLTFDLYYYISASPVSAYVDAGVVTGTGGLTGVVISPTLSANKPLDLPVATGLTQKRCAFALPDVNTGSGGSASRLGIKFHVNANTQQGTATDICIDNIVLHEHIDYLTLATSIDTSGVTT